MNRKNNELYFQKNPCGEKNQIHVHIDADAFFASVEQVLHRELFNKPVVIGQNGGIVSALSYPAKDLGISRVSPIITVRNKYPSVYIVASDFYSYSIFSKRMESIIRVHLPNLVKNSIDEGSAEISKWVPNFDEAEILVENLQKELFQKLGCTFSFGLARTPLLAKLASGMNKPDGITILDDNTVMEKISHIPVNHLSGIGTQSYKQLQRYSINTIGDFAKARPEWLRYTFSIAMPLLQKQVLGEVVSSPKQKEDIKSMSRDRSFPATDSYDYLHSQMSMNIEHLSKRMRGENLFAKRIGIKIRDQNLNHTQLFITLDSPTREPEYLLDQTNKLLKKLYREGIFYRQVSITCSGLDREIIQNDLFGELDVSQSKNDVLELLDTLENRFGKPCIGLASSLEAKENLKKIYTRYVPGDIYPHPLLPGEEIGRRLLYPYIGTVN